jgi:hypothetical protein
MVFFQVSFQRFWKMELIDTIVSSLAADNSSAQVLQGKREITMERNCEHGFKKHAA